MKTNDFNYNLPDNLIAQTRVHPYDHSRLLMLDKKTGKFKEEVFYNIVDYLTPNDILVFNDTKVFKARLKGKKESGANIEILLLEPFSIDKTNYQAIIRGKVKEDTKLIFEGSDTSAIVTKLYDNGNREIEFSHTGIALGKFLESFAHIPLPEYINSDNEKENDYQTVYAKDENANSIAAPTAGFHFTDDLLDRIKYKGIGIEYVTLNVGIGTFRPVKSENIVDHEMHYETYNIDKATMERLNKYKSEGRRIISVGTTSTRTLEDSSSPNGILEKESNNTNIFIHPPYEFKFVDALITNFHLPKSTLLMLVSAMAGRENILSAYKYAVDNNFRFYSFGDAMFIN